MRIAPPNANVRPRSGRNDGAGRHSAITRSSSATQDRAQSASGKAATVPRESEIRKNVKVSGKVRRIQKLALPPNIADATRRSDTARRIASGVANAASARIASRFVIVVSWLSVAT